MWDTFDSTSTNLSHDLPCQACGHAGHTYLPCSDQCECRPVVLADSLRVPVAA